MGLEEEFELEHDHNGSSRSGGVVGSGSFSERQPGQGRHVHRRLGAVVRLHRQLRPDRRVPGRRVGHLLEPDAAHARRLQAQPGAAGNTPSPTSRRAAPMPTDNGLTYTFQLKRRQVRPAGQPRGHLEGRRLRDGPARQPEGRRPVLLLLHGDQGLGRRTPTARRRSISGIETPERHDDRLPPDQADRRLPPPHVDARDGPIPEEVTKCFEGQPGEYGRDLVSTGPLHDPGHRPGRHASCSALKPMSGFDGANGNTSSSSATRTTTRRPTRTGRTTSTTFKFLVELERRRHLQQGRGRAARPRRARASRRSGPRSTRRTRP